MPFEFKPLDEGSRATFATWFRNPEVRRGATYPDDCWFDYITNDPCAHCWAIFDGNQMVAEIQVDAFPSEPATIAIVVDPEAHGQGIGTAVLGAFLTAFAERFPQIDAFIEPVNPASITVFERNGFTQAGLVDNDGFLRFSWKADRPCRMDRRNPCLPSG